MRAIRHILSWLLSLFLIFILLHWTVHPWPDRPEGFVIFFDPPGTNVIFARIAEQSGMSFFEPLGRKIFGGVELLAAFLLLIPPLRRIGAGVACACFVTLIGLHLSPWLGMEISLPDEGGGTDGGSMFYLTVACLTAGLLLMNVHPGRRR